MSLPKLLHFLSHSFIRLELVISQGRRCPTWPVRLAVSDIPCLHAKLFQALKHLWSYRGMTELISVAKYSSNDRRHGESDGHKEDQSRSQSQMDNAQDTHMR